ncbi:MAG: hypothetical protein A2W23_00730 [Planctomycetes bacterium RBG_16_43_13]|nr:MAG: hypothetical protein A2W23_00730 [Planctomycetes bacterium RBG_16_43_13]
MVVQFYNLAFNMYHAENAQQIQNLFQTTARAENSFAATQTQDTAKLEQSEQVQTTTAVQNKEIAGDGRGAHSYTLTKEEREEKEEEEKSPPDPTGKGQNLDLVG